LEIRRYPRLTEIGAWRVPAGAARDDIDPATGRPREYGGYYTQQEVRDLVAYAAARNVTIVPEIEIPGHASAPIVAYPALGVDGRSTLTEVPADWGVYQNLYNVEEDTFTFLENVMLEVMELFPSRYIHVGGDEAVKAQWESSPRVQARMRAFGVDNEHELQSYFIQRVERFLASHGRRLIGWDEILEGGLAPNATVMSWRGIDGAVAAARAGHDAVLAAWPTLYFDNRQTGSANEPPGRGRIVSVEEVYGFNPAPETLSADEQRHILGIQGNLWSEHIRTEPRMWRMAFPRGAAIAELGWSPPERIEWADFDRRLPAQMARYALLGLPPPPQAAPPQANVRRSQELTTCADKLVLSLEDDAPFQGERAVFLIDIMEPCWIWRGVDLAQVGAIRATVGQVPFNFQIGDDVNNIHFRAPRTRAGELEVRLGCDGARVAVLPLAPAHNTSATTQLPDAALARDGVHDLCFTFTQRDVEPMYAIDRIELLPRRRP
jgi:hexosaminidase